MWVTNQLICVHGNPNCGKTTVSIKLAKELTKRKKNVILIFCDYETPIISTVLPFTETSDKSLGALLSAVQITQESILHKCIPVSGDKYLSVLSYLQGENERTYAQYNKERIVDLLILLKHLADYIIIDCSSHIQQDLLSRSALDLSDHLIRLITPDLKALSYYDSSMPLLSERKYNLSKQQSILSKVKPEMPKDLVANKFRSIQYELTHSVELEQQFLEARLFDELVDRSSQSFKRTITEMVKALIGDDAEQLDVDEKRDKEKQKEKQKEKKMKVSIKQSANESLKQPSNESLNQSTNESLKQSLKQSFQQSLKRKKVEKTHDTL